MLTCCILAADRQSSFCHRNVWHLAKNRLFSDFHIGVRGGEVNNLNVLTVFIDNTSGERILASSCQICVSLLGRFWVAESSPNNVSRGYLVGRQPELSRRGMGGSG